MKGDEEGRERKREGRMRESDRPGGRRRRARILEAKRGRGARVKQRERRGRENKIQKKRKK